MSKPKHTPGPWKVEQTIGQTNFNPDYASITAPDDPDGAVNFVCLVESETLNNQTNARLIAAAPDMLNALHFIKTWLDENEGLTFRTVDEAINKAEGKD